MLQSPPSKSPPPNPSKTYLPHRFNVSDRIPAVFYNSKLVLSDLEGKIEKIDDHLPLIDELQLKKKLASSKNIPLLANKITFAGEYKKKPLRRHENDLLLYKEIFVQPKEKILVELKEKEKNFESLLYEGSVKQYDRILGVEEEEEGGGGRKEGKKGRRRGEEGEGRRKGEEVRRGEEGEGRRKEDDLDKKKKGEEGEGKILLNSRSDYYKREGELQMLLEKNSSFLKNEANPVTLNEKNEKKMIEKNFFDQQIQVQPPDMPNATIASPLTPGNGWAPSIPLTQNLKDSKINIKDLLVRAKAGMQAGDIQKEAHLSFYLGMVHENNKSFKDAIKFYKKFFSCAKLMEDKIGMALAANRIGVNYFNEKRFDKSLEFHQQNVILSDSENAFSGYYNLGILYRKMKEYNLALENFNKSLEWSQQKEELESECLSIGQIGVTNLELGLFDLAFEKLSRCYALSRKIKNTKLQLDCLMYITKISGNNVGEENFEGSIKILKDAIECAKSINDFKTASLCICNMGILEGGKRMNGVTSQFLEENFEMN